MSERLHELYEQEGQSAWLDNLRRDYITSGKLVDIRDGGARGLTSNPSIFQKAIQGSSDYDEQFAEIAADGGSTIDDYWSLVIRDIHGACDVFSKVYDHSDGVDGYVSVEVAPDLAHDGPGTEAAARDLHERINRRNLMVKIPGTEEGLAPIEQMIAEGRNINVTLIFSLPRYEKVIEAYIAGLEQLAADPDADLSQVASVASFFISRVDVEVDKRLEAIGSDDALALRGKAAVAQGKLAYKLFHGEVLRRPVGRTGGTRRPRAATAVGIDRRQEPGLPRHAVRRRADRPRHGQHAARCHARRVRRPRHRGPPRRRRRRRCRGRVGEARATSASTWTTSPTSSNAKVSPASRRRSTS